MAFHWFCVSRWNTKTMPQSGIRYTEWEVMHTVLIQMSALHVAGSEVGGVACCLGHSG